MAMLEVRGLSTQFVTSRGIVHAVNDVSFAVGPGELVGIVGETGCGKSATARSIIGLVRPPGYVVGGEVRLDGLDLLRMRREELRAIRGARIGFVTQNPFASLNPILSIEKQFLNVLRAHRHVSSGEARELALAKLRSVGIASPERVLRGHAHELSGGMAQRVVIAIAMILEPRLLIADEPTTALDVTVQRQTLDLIKGLLAKERGAMLLVTHDLGVVAQYSDSVVVMYAGKVVERGSVSEVFRRPAHPYTYALLRSAPQPGGTLVGLTGSVPDPIDYPAGCPFRFRCPFAFDRCVTDAPAPHPLADGRQVSCHLPMTDEVPGLAARRS